MSRLKQKEVNVRMKSVLLINWNIIVFVLILSLLLFRCETGSHLHSAKERHHLSQPQPLASPDQFEDMLAIPAETETEQWNTEEYTYLKENNFHATLNEPLSTFSIDVDNASYSNLRRFLSNNQLPPKDAVRIEEMVNYFEYQYPEPNGPHPFSITTELSSCPWNTKNQLLHIGIQGQNLNYEDLSASNLVFLIDVSGSMQDQNKLPLVKSAIKMLVRNLSDQDRISLVVYAGGAGVVLNSTPADKKESILKAIDDLEAGGSTAGSAGINLAYEIAMANKIEGGNNRVILATDGDFNVGVSSSGDLVRLIEEKRKSGVYLTICGFGMGNYKDSRMEAISNAGNGNYFYIDNIREAEKVFVTQMRANLFTIAKDVKIQVEFNPTKVKAYRLIGYENRVLENSDFDNDMKDAGELGAGHSVTALYELITDEGDFTGSSSRYVKNVPSEEALSNELITLKLRYKPIGRDDSELIVQHIKDKPVKWEKTSDNFRLSAAVAGFGMILRDSEFRNNLDYDQIVAMIPVNKPDQERSELLSLVKSAALLTAE